MTDALHQLQNNDEITLTARRSDGGTDIIRILRVDLEAPWRWLAKGLSDLTTMPNVSLVYGAVFAAIAVGLWFGLAQLGWQSLMLALAGGFMLIGPVLAVGLYEASKKRALDINSGLGDVIFAGLRASDQLSLLGLALAIIFMIWVQLAFLIFMTFFGDQPFPPIDAFIPHLLFTWQGVLLVVVGTITGACLAAAAFSISAISAPMLVDRPVGAPSAIIASLNAIAFNIKPMALWATLIAGFMAVGIATLCVGLIFIFPLIGHASWHAYREMVDIESKAGE